jgi:AcrR family transcriptional regulator
MPRPAVIAKAPAAGLSPREAERRTAILKGARDLVAEMGFRDAQMMAVAERAGVALGTLYRYFPSKVELMVEVVALVSQRELDVASAVASGEGRASERLAATAWTFASRAIKGRGMAHALLVEAVEPEIETERRKYARELAHVFEGVIERGIRSKELPAQDVRAAAACIVGSLVEGLIGSLALELRGNVEERLEHARAIVEFSVRGVSGKGHVFVPPADDVRVRSVRRK